MISATTESSEPEQFTGDDSNGEGRGCLLPHQPPADRTLILIGRIFAAVFFVLFVLICCFVLSQIYFDKRFTDDVAYAKKWILAAAAEQEIMETQQAQLANSMLKTKKLIEVLAAKELQIEVEQQEMKQDMNNDRNYVHKLQQNLNTSIEDNKEQIMKLEKDSQYALAEANCHHNGGQTFAGKCYTIFWKECYAKNFQFAKNFCMKQNQTLVYPSNLGELHFLSQFLWAFKGCPHMGLVKCKNNPHQYYSVDGKITINDTSPLWDEDFPKIDVKGRYACLAMDTMKLQNQCNGLHEFACFYKLLY